VGGANNWRETVTGEDWMRSQEKRTLHEERRPRVATASDILGPIMGPLAARVSDWNQAETAFNGLVWSEPGSLNSPNDAEHWIGEVIAQEDGFGVQLAWNYRTPGTPLLFVRTFASTGTTRTFTPWQQGGGGAQGDGTTWLTGAGAPAGNIGEVGNYYINTTTGEFYEKVGDTSWALRGSFRGPQGIQGIPGEKGDTGDQGIPGPEGDPGTPGSKWWTSTAAPDAALGIEGDYHLNVTTGDVSLKVGPLTWSLQGNIKGAKGDKGDTGDEGPQGPPGTLVPVQAEPDPGWPEGTVWWDTDEPVEDEFTWAPLEVWDPLTTYSDVSPVSVVTYDGSTWLATAPSTSEPPGTGSSWMLVAERGQDGAPGEDAPIDHTHEAADITSGTFDAARIPTLDASKVQYVPIRLFWTGSAWPARPAGAYSVDWIGPAGTAAPPWTSVDTWTQY
jgi:hypothetical protein